MRNLSQFTQAWPKAREPEIPSSDPELQDIFSLVERGDYARAADACETMFQVGVFDIRLLTIYMHQAVLEGGFASIGECFSILTKVLGDEKDKITPQKKKEDQIARRIDWYSSKTADALEYHRERSTSDWQAWTAALELTGVRTLVAQAEAFLTGFPESFGAEAQVTRLVGLLRERLAELEAAPEEAPPPPEEEADTHKSHDEPPQSQIPVLGAPGMMKLPISHRFVELLAKLQAFEDLLERSRFDKAALVGDDILSELRSFDPRDYFPQLFAEFSERIATNAERLSPYWDERESIQQQLLHQYYKVDLKGFVEE